MREEGERTRRPEVVVFEWLAPLAEWDAVAKETEHHPVPSEMSRAGAEPMHKSKWLISKAGGHSVVTNTAALT